ncbi:MAG: DMT family protein, partial [Deltaproteobacteria bacterium]|nr:DMT family protein [Deltaproteobacteria bacterium]
MSDALTAVGLLIVSNTFMTIAWYGHLRFRTWSMPAAILVSWGVALFEYVAQV